MIMTILPHSDPGFLYSSMFPWIWHPQIKIFSLSIHGFDPLESAVSWRFTQYVMSEFIWMSTPYTSCCQLQWFHLTPPFFSLFCAMSISRKSHNPVIFFRVLFLIICSNSATPVEAVISVFDSTVMKTEVKLFWALLIRPKRTYYLF